MGKRVVWALAFSACALTAGLARGGNEASHAIAFLRGDRVYLMNADGSVQRRTRFREMPVWSSDGRYMTYGVLRGRSWHLLVARGDGTHAHTIARWRDTVLNEAWSPNAARLAYDAGYDLDFRTTFVINRDGRRRKLLVPGTFHAKPRWAPDGRTILFASAPSEAGWFLYLIRPDGGGLQKIPNTAVDAGATYDDWFWAKDGRSIFLVSGHELFVLRRDGTQRQLLSGGLKVGSVDLSPDGRRLALMAAVGNADWDIYVMARDGSDLRNLTPNRAFDTSPRWSPDGHKIAFDTDRDGNSEIYVMNSDGTAQRNLTRNRAQDLSPVWIPRAQP